MKEKILPQSIIGESSSYASTQCSPVPNDNQNKNLNEKFQDTLDYFSKIENMNEFLSKTYPKFHENLELLSYINHGSMGIVFEGKLKKAHFQPKLAIKFKFDKKPKKEKKESQEVTILKKLHHNNIIEIYSQVNMNEFSQFSVLESAKYGDLIHFQEEILKRKVMSETMLNYFTYQILEGLSYMHKCKVVHMDIKHGNILVNSNLNIKIIDFSISCLYNDFHPLDLVKFPRVGTSKYMSPEILGGVNMKAKEACKIDLYSLGVTLYFSAIGSYPYNIDNIENKQYDQILNSIKTNKLEFPEKPKLSPMFKDFLSKLLEKDYRKRFNIVQALNHPWMKGTIIISEEKENTNCIENFLINLVTDKIMKFNEYLKNTPFLGNTKK